MKDLQNRYNENYKVFFREITEIKRTVMFTDER